MKRNEFEALAFFTKAGKRNESQWRNECPTRRWRSNTASGTDRRGVMMMIAFITFKSSLVPLFEGL